MVDLKEAIGIAKESNKGFTITQVMESETSYIFPVTEENAPDGSEYFYEVNKTTGEHGIFDYWGNSMWNSDFGEVMKSLKEIG